MMLIIAAAMKSRKDVINFLLKFQLDANELERKEVTYCLLKSGVYHKRKMEG